MVRTNFKPFPILVTDRLILRQLEKKDKKEIFALRSDADVAMYQDRPRQRRIADAKTYIRKINKGIANDDYILWGITLKDSVKVVGTICLWNISEEHSKADIGYELLPAFQGRGIMQEAIIPVINYGFKVMLLNDIEAYTHSNNSKSIKLLEKYYFIKQNDRNELHQEVVFKLNKAAFLR